MKFKGGGNNTFGNPDWLSPTFLTSKASFQLSFGKAGAKQNFARCFFASSCTFFHMSTTTSGSRSFFASNSRTKLKATIKYWFRKAEQKVKFASLFSLTKKPNQQSYHT